MKNGRVTRATVIVGVDAAMRVRSLDSALGKRRLRKRGIEFDLGANMYYGTIKAE